jgi:hypothetical protein
MKNPPKNYGVSEALREAGFVRLPAWWVKREDLAIIHQMAHEHEDEVTRIRVEARRKQTEEEAWLKHAEQ